MPNPPNAMPAQPQSPALPQSRHAVSIQNGLYHFYLVEHGSGYVCKSIGDDREAQANMEELALRWNAHPALVAAARAALAYDAAIKSCANNPEQMASFCTAQGDTLDDLYFEWQELSADALAQCQPATEPAE